MTAYAPNIIASKFIKQSLEQLQETHQEKATIVLSQQMTGQNKLLQIT